MITLAKEAASSSTFPWTLVAAGVAAIVSVFNTGVLATWQARSRRRHERDLAEARSKQEVELARIKSEHELQAANAKANDERLKRLGDESAVYAGLVLQQGEYVSLLLKSHSPLPDIEGQLRDSHGRVRIQYERLLLMTNSTEVQQSARQVMRAAWNERQQGLGLERKRERRFGESSPVKELRAELREFTRAVRRELGLSEELIEEFSD